MKKFLLPLLLIAVVIFHGCGAVEQAVDNIMMGSYEIGTIDGDNFESEWLSLRFTAPEGFLMSSREEMMEMMAVGMEMMDVDAGTAAWADMATVSEMSAMLPTGLASATVVTERVFQAAMTVEQYVEAAIQGVETALGWDVTLTSEITPINFAGQQWYTYTANIEAFGMDWSYRYFVRRFDNRMALITIYALEGQEDYLDVLTDAFRAY